MLIHHHPSSVISPWPLPVAITIVSGPVDGLDGPFEVGATVSWPRGAHASSNPSYTLQVSCAPAAVLERLNPLLEAPPMWVVSERGDTDPLPRGRGFQLAATMTPPSLSRRGASATDVGTLGSELSPVSPSTWPRVRACFGNHGIIYQQRLGPSRGICFLCFPATSA
jgi:hypothetical protein